MTKKFKVAITVAFAVLLAAIGGSWYLQQTPKSGAACSTPGQVAETADGSLLNCQDDVQWIPAKFERAGDERNPEWERKSLDQPPLK